MHNSSSTCAAILLVGGVGSRMQTALPKQLLMLGNKPLARHSFDVLLEAAEIAEIVVVCHPDHQKIFSTSASAKPVFFASPGARRQDSTYNGLQKVSETHQFICVHDAARPFITHRLIKDTWNAAQKYGVATVGMPLKFTVKECDSKHFVLRTPDRSALWEIQTPQIIRRDWLTEGFDHAIAEHQTVTDDVSLVELLGKQVKLVEGSYDNIKITVPSDLAFANHLYKSLTS